MGLKILHAVNDLGREEQWPGDTAAFDLEREGLDPGDVMMTRFHGPSLTPATEACEERAVERS